MLKRNDPARRGEAVECFLAGCRDGHITGALRAEVLTARFHVHPRRAALVAAHAWGMHHG